MLKPGPEAAATPGEAPPDSRVLAVAAPLFVAALAFALWLMSDRLLTVGPLDRATFGWSVVVPIWAAAPLAAAFAWRRLIPRARYLAATTCGLIVGGFTAALLWQAVAFPACQFGPVRDPAGWLLPAAAVGALVGAGFGLAGLVAGAEVRAGRSCRALVLGVATQLGVMFVSIVLFFALSLGGACQRPPV